MDRKLRVFLCHGSQDKPVVRELYQRLLAEGWIDPWLDEEKLLPGQDWDMEIEEAVEAADAVIVCLSNNSTTKEGYVQKELRKVLDVSDEKPEGTIFVIPVRLDDIQIPRRLRMWQYVDLFPETQKTASHLRLISSLRKRVESTSLPIAITSSTNEDIAILIHLLDGAENLVSAFYFITSPNITLDELMENIKKEYPDEFSREIGDYQVELKLLLGDTLDNLEITNDSRLTIRPHDST